MNQYRVEGAIPAGRVLHHPLELGTPIIGRRGAGLDILGDNIEAVLLAPGLELPPLVRDRQVLLGLPRGRDAEVECSTAH